MKQLLCTLTLLVLLNGCGKKNHRSFKDLPEITSDMSTYQMLQTLGDTNHIARETYINNYNNKKKAAKKPDQPDRDYGEINLYEQKTKNLFES